MITKEKAVVKKIKNLIDTAQKLAAVQYLHGLRPDDQKVKQKVDKIWNEFNLAADSMVNQAAVLLKQENGRPIGIDRNK